MKTKIALLAAALCLGGAQAALAADAMPAGTLITGTVSGAATGLLGLDHAYNDEPGTNTTALSAADQEFITSDYALAIDFGTDGSVLFWNNTGNTALPGTYTLTFNFNASSPTIIGFALGDISQVTAGTITPQVLGAHSVSISFSNVGTAAEFGNFSAQLTTAAAVPEPATFGLLGAGLFLVAAGSRRARREGRTA